MYRSKQRKATCSGQIFAKPCQEVNPYQFKRNDDENNDCGLSIGYSIGEGVYQEAELDADLPVSNPLVIALKFSAVSHKSR